MIALALVVQLLAGELADERRGAGVEPGARTTLQSAAEAPGEGGAFGLPVDKVLHASISANLSVGLTALCMAAGMPRRWALLAGFGFTVAIGAFKELVWDGLLKRGTPDPIDLAFGTIGAGSGTVVVAVAIAITEQSVAAALGWKP